MTPLIYKLRVENPNYKSTAPKMYKYTFYMGRRDGVVKNEDMGHGLFGKVDHNNNGNFGNITNITQTANYIRSKVEQGTIMYDNIISISKEDYMRLGYDDQRAWKDLIKNEAHKMAEKIGIPPSRLEYVAAMHIQDGKPNCHLVFWDKNQGVKEPFVHSKVAMNIRSNLIKVIYKEDMEILQQVKNEARNTLTSEADEFYKDFLNPINKMTKIEYTELEAKLKENPDMNLGRLFDMNKIPNKLLDETAHKITELNKILPKKGRIAYKLLPPDVKVKVDEIVEYIIENIPEFKKEFNTYKKMSRALTNFYTTNTKTLDNAEQKAHEELRKRLANKLLSNIKSINYNNYLEAKGMREKQMMRNMATKIIMDLFKFLTSTNEAKQKRYDNYKGELSKQAKKEMAIRMQNAGAIDWENER